MNIENLVKEGEDTSVPDLGLPKECNQEDIVMDDGHWLINAKLSGLYYIDSMSFEYNQSSARIIQTLHLIKKGKTTGYENRYNNPKLKDNISKSVSQSSQYILENNIK
jgi:hypothetical protein